VLRHPELDARLQVGSHQSRAEWQNHLLQPADHTAFDVAQAMVNLLDCKHTLLGHVELLVNQHPQVLLGRAALNPFSIQPVFVLDIAPTNVQEPALGLVELHKVHTGPPLKPVKVPLDVIPYFQCVGHTTLLGVVGSCYGLAAAGNKSAMRPPLPPLGCGGEWKETGRNW